MPSGDDPVGRPRTNGFSGVGANDLIRPRICQLGADPVREAVRTDYVVGDISRCFVPLIADNETHGRIPARSTFLLWKRLGWSASDKSLNSLLAVFEVHAIESDVLT